MELLDQPIPAHADAPVSAPIPFDNTITLKGLAFRYAENTPYVIQHGFTLSIPKGSRIGFIGATGSGKSTLLDILMETLRLMALRLLSKINVAGRRTLHMFPKPFF